MDNFFANFKKPLGELWQNNKVFLICFGLLLLIWQFRQVLIDLLISGSKELVADSTKKNEVLLNEQNKANDQANQLVKEAQDLNNNKPSVDENWNKK